MAKELRDRDKVIGVMTIDRAWIRVADMRTDEDVRFLKMVANLIGQAVRLHRLVMRDRERQAQSPPVNLRRADGSERPIGGPLLQWLNERLTARGAQELRIVQGLWRAVATRQHDGANGQGARECPSPDLVNSHNDLAALEQRSLDAQHVNGRGHHLKGSEVIDP